MILMRWSVCGYLSMGFVSGLLSRVRKLSLHRMLVNSSFVPRPSNASLSTIGY
jgi:hypothetical protein